MVLPVTYMRDGVVSRVRGAEQLLANDRDSYPPRRMFSFFMRA